MRQLTTPVRERVETFLAFLVQQRMRRTGARIAIAREALLRPGYFRAEDLIQDDQGRLRRMPGATVYRTLSLMVAAGLLQHLKLGWYGSTSGGTTYTHLVCHRCKRITEFAAEALAELVRDIDRGCQFQVTTLEASGICEDCRIKRHRLPRTASRVALWGRGSSDPPVSRGEPKK